ncbi:hypothetical protein [Synechococcus sp. CS-205]|nr:hypothetical protein [Synechococcus sp. CS-205]MCT0249164.1 hypothetical protein [Synechococcus sp. CS-205]
MAPLANAALIEAAATAVVAHAEELTELDRAIGDRRGEYRRRLPGERLR